MGERDRGTRSLTLEDLSEGGSVRCELETQAPGLSVTADTFSKCHKEGQMCAGALLSALIQTLEVLLLLGPPREMTAVMTCVCVCVCVCVSQLIVDIHNLSVPSPPTLSHVSVALIRPLICE